MYSKYFIKFKVFHKIQRISEIENHVCMIYILCHYILVLTFGSFVCLFFLSMSFYDKSY